VTDVVGYYYGLFAPRTYVAPDQMGGDATVDVSPDSSGPTRLVAYSVDRTGNRSPERTYEFWVRDNTPVVSSNPPHGGLAEPREFTFAARVDGVVEYTYQLNDNPVQTVAANGDGVATVTITPAKWGPNYLAVRSRTSAGVVSAPDNFHFYVSGAEPCVNSDDYPQDPFEGMGGPGVPGTFQFAPNLSGTVEYVYSLDGAPETVVAAGPDGRATVTITPARAGAQTLIVRSRRADGIESRSTTYDIVVKG
jgi:hypothetical protein